MTKEALEARVERLEKALEDLLECFDLQGNGYYLIATNAGLDDGAVDVQGNEAIEHALRVLYEDPDWDSEEAPF